MLAGPLRCPRRPWSSICHALHLPERRHPWGPAAPLPGRPPCLTPGAQRRRYPCCRVSLQPCPLRAKRLAESRRIWSRICCGHEVCSLVANCAVYPHGRHRVLSMHLVWEVIRVLGYSHAAGLPGYFCGCPRGLPCDRCSFHCIQPPCCSGSPTPSLPPSFSACVCEREFCNSFSPPFPTSPCPSSGESSGSL